MLGFISKYMVRGPNTQSQTWKTFVRSCPRFLSAQMRDRGDLDQEFRFYQVGADAIARRRILGKYSR